MLEPSSASFGAAPNEHRRPASRDRRRRHQRFDRGAGLVERHTWNAPTAGAAARPIRARREAMQRLQTYGWPRNIRELRNAVERAMLLVEGTELTANQFP